MKKPKEEVLSTEELVQSRVFKIKRARVRIASGRETNFDIVEHPGAVVVLPVMNDGSILFIKQWRRAVNQELLEIVAGTLEVGEDPLDCAKRELAEETFFAAKEWIPLGTMYPAPGFCSEIQHGFLARGLTPCEGTPDEDEIIESHPMTMQEVRKSMANGEISDGKSLAFLMRAMEKGLVK